MQQPTAGIDTDRPYDLGLPYTSLGGYGSQTLDDNVRRLVEADGRPAIALLATDLDRPG